MIVQETIDKVYRTAQLEDVVGDYVELHPQGADQRGPCPFHQGKKWNFSYSPSKGICRCFKCGESAKNAVEFVMKVEGIKWPEAVRMVAKRYGIEVVETALSSEAQAAKTRRESYRALCETVQVWYSQQLWANEAQEVQEYLTARGIDEEQARLFGLGYSPKLGTELGRYLLTLGYTPEQLEAHHVVYMDKNHDLRDKYAGRLVFPLYDEYGRCIGFSGRYLGTPSAEVSKYVNSRESEGYQKRYTLYGYHLARTAMVRSKRAFLVEGLTDVMAMHACGLTNTVGSQGTAVTKEQIALLKRSCSHIVVILDGDDAGQKATQRLLEPLLAAGCTCEVVVLSDGDDPASYAQRHGSEALQETASTNAVDFIRYLWGQVSHLEDIQVRAECRKTIIELIAQVPDKVYRHEYIAQAAEVLRMEMKLIGDEVEVIMAALTKQHHKPSTKRAVYDASSTRSSNTITSTASCLEWQVSIQAVLVEREMSLIQDMLVHGDELVHWKIDAPPYSVKEYIAEVRRQEDWTFTGKALESLYHHMQSGGMGTAHPDIYAASIAQDMLNKQQQIMKVMPEAVREQLLPLVRCSVSAHIRLYKEAIIKKQALEKHHAGVAQLQSILKKGTTHKERETIDE